MTETLAPYEFDYAMSRLKDAIDYAFQTGELEGVRLWAMNVEESHKAEVKDLSDSLRDANEGAHLMYMYGQGGEPKLLQDWGMGEAEREPYTDRTVTVPQTLRSYASYNNTGRGQPLPAEDVDGERLGE